MTREEIVEKVNEFLIEDFEIEEDRLVGSNHLKNDVGIDSLDYVDIVVTVNKIFGFKIQNGELVNVHTLDDFYDFIAQKVG